MPDAEVQRGLLPGAAAETGSAPFDALPTDILEKIFGDLCTGDRVRMRLVCKSWNNMLMREDIPVAAEAPWLIQSYNSKSKPELFSNEIRFRSLHEGRTYRFKFPFDGRWCCCGYSKGWLLIGGGRGCNLRTTEMCLWNPLTGDCRKLPSLSSLPFFGEAVDRGVRAGFDSISSYIQRVQVFSVNSVECVVAAIFVDAAQVDLPHPQLLLCTPQDKRWTVVHNDDEHVRDILFHKGKLLACCRPDDDDEEEDVIMNEDEEEEEEEEEEEDVGEMGMYEAIVRKSNRAIYLSGCGVEVDIDMFNLLYEDAVPYDGPYIGFRIRKRSRVVEHLVESSTTGELLAVSAILDSQEYYNPMVQPRQGDLSTFVSSETTGFEVRRLAGESLEKMNSMGKQGIFIGGATGASSFQSTLDGVEAERIYFSTDYAFTTVSCDRDEHDNDSDDGAEAADGGDDEDVAEVVEHEIEEDSGADDEEEPGIEPVRVYSVDERGEFDLQRSRIRTLSVTSLPYQSGVITGWFTPKLF